MRVLVLGAGFGGLELAATLSAELGDNGDAVLIDQSDHFIFGFSKLDVMFGKQRADEVRHRYEDVTKPGVQFVQSVIRSIDPKAKRVETASGIYEGDVLVVALGADLDPSDTPGLLEVGHEFYTPQGAFALRDVLAAFEGGDVVIGVTSTPFKCPPAPSETALMMHDLLTERGVRERSTISLVMPLGVPIPPAPAASEALLKAFSARGIAWHPNRLVDHLDKDRKVIARHRGAEAQTGYAGRGVCYLEFGHHAVGKVDVTFLSGQAPVGALEGPSEVIAEEKVAFGASRIQRWFGRQWSTGGS